MTEIGNRIRKAMEIRNMRQSDIVDRTGINKGALSSYISGRYSPKQNNIYLIAKALDVSEAWLMGADVPMERTVLPPGAIPLGRYRIPIVAVVAAGVPIYSEDNIVGYVDYDRDPHGEVFALRVKGDSMVPKIENGDLVIVDKSVSWEDNDIVIVRVNGHEGTCKRVKRYAEGISLISINPAYEPMYYSREQVEQLPVEVVGRVMEVRSKV